MIYDIKGQFIAEYSVSSPPGNSQTSYMTSDSLGTPRVITDSTGTVKSRHDYLPFGEEISVNIGGRNTGQNYVYGAGDDGVRQKFTGYELDNETGLEYAQARYYANSHGRFTSPDPSLLSVSANNPQTWNRYTYVINNPLAFTDPAGLWAINAIANYKVAERHEDGTVVYATDENGQKIVESVTVIATRTSEDDTGASLAGQLGLTGKTATEFANVVGTQTDVNLSAVADQGKVSDGIKYIAQVFEAVGEGLAKQAESMRTSGHSPTSANCAGSACKIGLRNNFFGGSIEPTDFDRILNSSARRVASESSLQVGDIVRYATDGGRTPQHFANFIFRDDAGVPLVFSKSGVTGPYEIRSAQSLEGRQAPNVNYGAISGFFRR